MGRASPRRLALPRRSRLGAATSLHIGPVFRVRRRRERHHGGGDVARIERAVDIASRRGVRRVPRHDATAPARRVRDPSRSRPRRRRRARAGQDERRTRHRRGGALLVPYRRDFIVRGICGARAQRGSRPSRAERGGKRGDGAPHVQSKIWRFRSGCAARRAHERVFRGEAGRCAERKELGTLEKVFRGVRGALRELSRRGRRGRTIGDGGV